MQATEAASLISATASTRVRFPHGIELIPALLKGCPVRFATIDRDGCLTAWVGDEAPELLNGYGAWVGKTGADSVHLGRVCSGHYPAYREALREIADAPVCSAESRRAPESAIAGG